MAEMATGIVRGHQVDNIGFHCGTWYSDDPVDVEKQTVPQPCFPQRSTHQFSGYRGRKMTSISWLFMLRRFRKFV
jgi:hypothetical protein